MIMLRSINAKSGIASVKIIFEADTFQETEAAECCL